MRKLSHIAVAVGLLLAPAAAIAAEDTLIVPGERVGFITASSTEAGIIAKLKPGQYTRGILAVGEGFGRRALIIYPDTAKELSITWKSDKKELDSAQWGSAWAAPMTLEKPDFITIGKPKTPWHTADGITIGTPLKKLRDINGTTFIFAGYNWDYSGRTYSWTSGKISSCLGANIDVEHAERLSDLPTGAPDVYSDSDIVLKYANQMYVGTLYIAFPDSYGGRCN